MQDFTRLMLDLPHHSIFNPDSDYSQRRRQRKEMAYAAKVAYGDRSLVDSRTALGWASACSLVMGATCLLVGWTLL